MNYCLSTYLRLHQTHAVSQLCDTNIKELKRGVSLRLLRQLKFIYDNLYFTTNGSKIIYNKNKLIKLQYKKTN